VGDAAAVLRIGAAGATVDVVVSEELVVDSTTVVELSADVVVWSGVVEDATVEHPAATTRDAQRPATARRRSTQQYGTPEAALRGRN
jgi:hypothetical protein